MRRIVIAVSAVVALLIAFLGGRYSGESLRVAGPDTVAASAVAAARLSDIEAELERTQQLKANLQAALDVEREASARVRSDLATAQSQIGQIEQEVDLYRGLLDSSAQQSGLGVHLFEVEKGGEANSYRFRLVLVQRTRRYSEIAGTLRLGIRGSLGDSPRVLSYAELGVPRGTSTLPFRLVYFQVIEGAIELPEGFVAKDVLIDAEITSGRRQRLTLRRDWKPQESL